MSGLYAGLDVSDKTTRVCIIDARREIVHEATVASSPTAIGRELKPYRALLEGVAQEAGSLSQWLHKELSKKRFPMVCLDARHAHGVLSLKRAKTDVADARGLAETMCSGWYRTAHVRSDEAQRLRLIVIHRATIQRKARDLEHSLRMSVKPFGGRLEIRRDRVSIRLAQGCRDRSLVRLTQNIIRARKALLAEVDELNKVVAVAAKQDPICRRLMKVPGVGPITALAYRTSIDEPTRFRSSSAVGAYFGLTPRRFQSGESDHSGGISKLGDQLARTALYSAAFSMIVASTSKCRLRAWALRLRKRKGLRSACVATARRLAVVLHRIWITGREFDATPAQRPRRRTKK